jgi:NAD(P)-dependent dehydrogenase (short-subunit alcohol dehydrogenase family)
MAARLKPIPNQVIVITGASSGIGLATAKAAAAHGAKVVLTARSEDALNKAVQEIAAASGQAIAVAADVGRRADLQRVADRAVERFGRIDTWVNNAGVGIWGRIEEVSEEDMRRLFETNFWGQVYGSLVALPHLKRNGGALINVGSMVSDRAVPLQGIYSASKHALKGFTDALRMELEEEGAPVSVTLIKPGSIGTPMPQHVKNYTNSEPKFPPPVYAAAHPTRDAFVGGAARGISTLSQVAPRLVDWVSERTAFQAQLGPKPPSPGDNLYQGRAEARVRGDHQGSTVRPSLYTRAALHPGVTTVLTGLALAGVAQLVMSRRADGARERASTPRLSGPPRRADHPDHRSDGTGPSAGRERPISTGPNARPRDETISQTAPGLPDDSSHQVEISPDEERRIAQSIRAL